LPTPPLDPEAELDASIRVRKAFDLKSGRDYVRSVINDPSSVMSDLGILVTPQELPAVQKDFEPRSARVAYGLRHADEYGGLYNAGGHDVMFFTGHLAEHQAAINDLPGGAGTGVELCRYTEADLRSAQDDLVSKWPQLRTEGIQVWSAGLDTINNVVTVEAQSNRPDAESLLEAPYGGKVVAKVDPLPGPWSNNAGGAGWRLASDFEGGSGWAYRVDAATSEAQWSMVWDKLSPRVDRPAIDFEDEIAVVFGEAHGSSCPDIRFDDLVIDHTRNVVYAETSNPLGNIPCTADLSGAHVFVVAVARSALPPMPFTLQLADVPACCVDSGRITVGNN